MKFVITLVLFLVTPTASLLAADFKYVTDQFKIMMRTGES